MSHAADPMLSSLLSRVDAVIVDLDGTMVDTLGDFAVATFKAQGIPHDMVVSGRVPNLDLARLSADL